MTVTRRPATSIAGERSIRPLLPRFHALHGFRGPGPRSIADDNLEAQVGDHAIIIFSRLSLGREVIADEQ